MSVTFSPAFGARSHSVDSNFVREFSQSWLAQTSDQQYGPVYVKQQFIAQVGINLGLASSYSAGSGTFAEGDAGSQVKAISVSEVANADGTLWTVRVDYAPWNILTDFVDNPLNLPPRFSASGQTYQKIIDQDIHGNPIINSAGDPFSAGAEADDMRTQIRVSYNVATFPAFAFAYNNYINSQPLFGLPTGTVKQAPPDVADQFHPACGKYYSLSLLFDHNPDGWDLELLNEGFKYLDSNGKQQPILVGATYTPTAMPLDTQGHVIPIPANSSDLVTLVFTRYRSIDFTTIYPLANLP